MPYSSCALAQAPPSTGDNQLPAPALAFSGSWPARPGRQATQARPCSGRTACHAATCAIGNWILHPTGCLLLLLQRSFSCTATSSSPVTRHPSSIRSSLSAPLLSASPFPPASQSRTCRGRLSNNCARDLHPRLSSIASSPSRKRCRQPPTPSPLGDGRPGSRL